MSTASTEPTDLYGAGPVHPGRQGVSGIAVQKYGGSSLATIRQLHQVARRVKGTHSTGRPTVVVVSARGNTTDELLRLAEVTGGGRNGRETDQLLATGEGASAALLAIALQNFGVPAVSLTGAQAGIRTVGRPGSGMIADIDTRRLREILADGAVAVVAGFQGVDDAGDVLTLGRGGSDTTAVAIATVLGADRCEICTDVPGIFTADPRLVADARVLPRVDVGVLAEMAFAGAKVMHSRAVELAAVNHVELQVRSSEENRSTRSGTIIPAGSDKAMIENQAVVVAIAHDLDVIRVCLHSGSVHENLAADVLSALSEQAAPVDMIAGPGPHDDDFRMSFTLERKDSEEALPAIRETLTGLGVTIHVDEKVGKLSLIGMGLLNRPEYTARMLSTLAAADIPASWLSSSQLRASVAIPADRLVAAVRLLHEEFGLDSDDLDPVWAASA